MDIEKTKKINELVAELKKHKMLDNGDDALARAERMVRKDDEETLSESKKEDTSPGPDKSEFGIILKEHAKIMKEELDLLRKGVLSINEEVQSVREKLTELERGMSQLKRQQAEPKVEPAPAKEEAETAPPKAEPKKEEADKTHPRQGNYSEDDVSIEKIFYAGKK